MNLTGKKLLLMGGAAFSQDIRKYADEQGFCLIGVGADISRLQTFCDETYQIDTQDVEALEKLVHKTGVDGIFVGTTEINIKPAIELSKRTGIYFYTNAEQWDILSSKKKFKDLLNKYKIGTIPEFKVDTSFAGEDISNITWPVLVKPEDSSGARGISIANNIEELKNSYEYALKFSQSKHVLIERLMTGMDDVFIRYHMQNGIYSISSSFDRHCNFTQGGFGGVAIAYLHPTKHLDAFVKKYDEKFKAVFSDLGLKDGMITLQGFVDEKEDFFFYEAGYRLGGSQSYIFTDKINQSNTLHYMINYALSGKMADYSIADRDNPYITTPCCNLYIALKPGTITVLDGVDAVRALPGVLNVTELSGVGTKIERTGSLNQVCMRMHLIGENKEILADTVSNVYKHLKILDENGQDMILEKFDLREYK